MTAPPRPSPRPRSEIWQAMTQVERVAWLVGTRADRDRLEIGACRRLSAIAERATPKRVDSKT